MWKASFGPILTVHVADPALIEQVLRQEGQHPMRSDLSSWKDYRKLRGHHYGLLTAWVFHIHSLDRLKKLLPQMWSWMICASTIWDRLPIYQMRQYYDEKSKQKTNKGAAWILKCKHGIAVSQLLQLEFCFISTCCVFPERARSGSRWGASWGSTCCDRRLWKLMTRPSTALSVTSSPNFAWAKAPKASSPTSPASSIASASKVRLHTQSTTVCLQWELVPTTLKGQCCGDLDIQNMMWPNHLFIFYQLPIRKYHKSISQVQKWWTEYDHYPIFFDKLDVNKGI